MKSRIKRYGANEVCKIKYGGKDHGLDSGIEYFTFDSLERTGIVKHMFTTRNGGVSGDCFSTLNFSYTRGDKKECVDENFRRAAAVFGKTPDDIVCSVQTHTTNVRMVTVDDKGKGVTKERDYSDTDGLITNERGIMLATFYADCVPLFIVDTRNKAIGLSHSGWRGTVGKMGQATLKAMSKAYGTTPKDVKAAIAPSICQSCYEVDADVAEAFSGSFKRDDDKAVEYLERYTSLITDKDIENCLLYKKTNGKYQLNLWYANFRVFRDAGVPNENIEITDVCTCCNPNLLFSHRASKGKRGNLGAFMMLV